MQERPCRTYPEKILYDRKSAAYALSISIRSLDYLVANKKLGFRRIGRKVLIPAAELRQYASGNHCSPVRGAAAQG